jgi:hypothetical protein
MMQIGIIGFGKLETGHKLFKEPFSADGLGSAGRVMSGIVA